jgi:hypothetical protein
LVSLEVIKNNEKTISNPFIKHAIYLRTNTELSTRRYLKHSEEKERLYQPGDFYRSFRIILVMSILEKWPINPLFLPNFR